MIITTKGNKTIDISVPAVGLHTVETIVYDGRKLSTMTEDTLMQEIAKIVKKQTLLKDSNKVLKSTRVKGKIAALGKLRNALVDYLDEQPDENTNEPTNEPTGE